MPDSPSNSPPETRSRTARVCSGLVMGLSLLLFGFLSLCYTKQYDACTAVTVYPNWVWFLCGLCLALILLRTGSKRTAWLTMSLWILFLVVFADTPLSLVRGIGGQAEQNKFNVEGEQSALRVISLNCSGKTKSILALKEWNPDLILIQESPGVDNLKITADELFGAEGNVLSGMDASIITKGKVQRFAASGIYTIGKITLPEGREMAVASLRLSPPPFRFDLWNPNCWRAYTSIGLNSEPKSLR